MESRSWSLLFLHAMILLDDFSPKYEKNCRVRRANRFNTYYHLKLINMDSPFPRIPKALTPFSYIIYRYSIYTLATPLSNISSIPYFSSLPCTLKILIPPPLLKPSIIPHTHTFELWELKPRFVVF